MESGWRVKSGIESGLIVENAEWESREWRVWIRESGV